MDNATIQRLNQINRDFYNATAADFNETRQQPWQGWERLLPHVPKNRPLSVLDVGCGNGRFGIFLAKSIEGKLRYHGMDNNHDLLNYALAALDFRATLEERDVVTNPPDNGAFDLVVAFGLLHHIPGSAKRRAFVRTLADRVAPGGVMAYTCWRFYEFDRFRDKIAPFPDDIHAEPNDYLLDWQRGATALRYCHYVDDAEHDRLIEASGLDVIDDYRADGSTNNVNRYAVLYRPK